MVRSNKSQRQPHQVGTIYCWSNRLCQTNNTIYGAFCDEPFTISSNFLRIWVFSWCQIFFEHISNCEHVYKEKCCVDVVGQKSKSTCTVSMRIFFRRYWVCVLFSNWNIIRFHCKTCFRNIYNRNISYLSNGLQVYWTIKRNK